MDCNQLVDDARFVSLIKWKREQALELRLGLGEDRRMLDIYPSSFSDFGTDINCGLYDEVILVSQEQRPSHQDISHPELSYKP